MKLHGMLFLGLLSLFSLSVYSNQIVTEPYDLVLKSTLKHSSNKILKDNLGKGLNQFNGVSKVKVSDTYRTLALFTNAARYSGMGDIHYWIRVTEDLSVLAWALGDVYSSLSRHISNKTIQVAVNQLGVDLKNIEVGDSGNVDYWENRAKYIGEAISKKSKQVVELTSSLNEDKIDLKYVVISTSLVLLIIEPSGKGNADYWQRVALDFELFSKAGVKVINELSKIIDADIASILTSYASRLKDISASGYGDVTYWRDKVSNLSQELYEIGTGLVAVGKTL